MILLAGQLEQVGSTSKHNRRSSHTLEGVCTLLILEGRMHSQSEYYIV